MEPAYWKIVIYWFNYIELTTSFTRIEASVSVSVVWLCGAFCGSLALDNLFLHYCGIISGVHFESSLCQHSFNRKVIGLIIFYDCYAGRSCLSDQLARGRLSTFNRSWWTTCRKTSTCRLLLISQHRRVQTKRRYNLPDGQHTIHSAVVLSRREHLCWWNNK